MVTKRLRCELMSALFDYYDDGKSDFPFSINFLVSINSDYSSFSSLDDLQRKVVSDLVQLVQAISYYKLFND